MSGETLRIVPANDAACDDLQVVFGEHGTGSVCQCQRYKLEPGESFRSVPREERMFRLWDQTDCGNPRLQSHHRSGGVPGRRAGGVVRLGAAR
jgi:hypothetical protein